MVDSTSFGMKTQEMMGLLLVPFSLLGVFSNWAIVLVMFKPRTTHHPFTVLTANQAFLEACHSTIYLFYVSPMIIFDIQYFKIYSYHAGWIILIVYDASMQIHFAMTINRLLAVFAPFMYQNIFSKKNTRNIWVISFGTSFIVITFFFRILDCRMTYLDQNWMFEYSMQPICVSYMYVNDIAKVSILAIANVIIDTITISRVYYGRAKLRMSGAVVGNSSFFKKKEINFLKQSFGQGLALFLGLSVYIFAPEVVSDPMRAFIVSTLFWCALHAFDGTVTLIYNSDAQKSLRSLLKRKTKPLEVSHQS